MRLFYAPDCFSLTPASGLSLLPERAVTSRFRFAAKSKSSFIVRQFLLGVPWLGWLGVVWVWGRVMGGGYGFWAGGFASRGLARRLFMRGRGGGGWLGAT